MKLLITVITALCFSLSTIQAQVKYPSIDKSNMDMAYYPPNYPLLKIQGKNTEPLTARVIYSRPHKNGRVIFGNLLEYGKVWRLGANEATEIEFFTDVKIGDTKVKKGRYTMYAIPGETEWTIIINKDTDIWGSFKYDEKNDVVRIILPVQKLTDTKEDFSMVFTKADIGADLNIGWENVQISLPIVF
ncbi:MAG TPA: DUF2911 domain-containing protein [Ferruginibacter sp.]|nr:DUF2911 domain-containing protein [Ferruginibacter sp.]